MLKNFNGALVAQNSHLCSFCAFYQKVLWNQKQMKNYANIFVFKFASLLWNMQ